MQLLEKDSGFKTWYLEFLRTRYKMMYATDLSKRMVGIEAEKQLVDVRKGSPTFGQAIGAKRTRKLFREISAGRGTWKVAKDGLGIDGAIGRFQYSLSTDYGKATLEMRCPPAVTLAEAEAALNTITLRVTEAADGLGIGILGYGLHPFTRPSGKLRVKRDRYSAIHYTLRDPNDPESKYYLNCQTIIAASQMHIEMAYAEHGIMARIFTRFSPSIIALTANARVKEGKDSGYQDLRIEIWDHFTTKLEHMGRTGIGPGRPDSEGYLLELFSYPLLFTKRGERGSEEYFIFDRPMTLGQFASRGKAMATSIRNGERVSLEYSEKEDMEVLMGSLWWEFRPTLYGTGELRSPSAQPGIAEDMALAALVKGLAYNQKEALERVERYSDAEIMEGRGSASKHALKGVIGEERREPIWEQAGDMLEIARWGLIMAGEDASMLEPLYERLRSRKSPAELTIGELEKGVEPFINALRYRS